ncbi:undecaprenyldiphospho-muramoylpentapeptide beta-N-acetylglucosaminyltransferase [Sandaracinobacteroides saxicola]|uniref:undecaprenyldiphospho-muramoylpentapeptide beta-N-acetylglucosaminyltransferase n=1 Tax=Sandaracinobacteroides saxicola TaxID=2759707 RepID=UPI001FB053CE|nr:undecaprenyldiphospho-muramoylpentapeptide beta-N-acetylglucosaminyltransferase [Sandaracinobacteroides saxicola]
MTAAIILAAGGTGGHMVPAHALSEVLRQRGHHITLLTDARGLRFPGLFAGVDRHVIPAATISGLNPLRWLSALNTIRKGRAAARAIIATTQARAVVGFGGYPALPALLAGLAARLPAILHEQNAVLGRVNRFLASRVGTIALSYADTARLRPTDAARAITTGNPVRADVLAGAAAPFTAPAPNEPFHLLVTGGSQGASILSRILPAALATLAPADKSRLRIAQQCRPEDLSEVATVYKAAGIEAECLTYMEDLPARIAAAHLVIARSGASTMAELSVIGRPAILVPFAAATDDHQAANAREFVSAGGGIMLREAEFTATTVAGAVTGFMRDSAGLAHAAAAAKSTGHPDAACRLADLVEGLIA